MMEQLEQDMITAMKSGEKRKLTVLREIKAGMKQANIDQKKEMNDDLFIEIVSRGIKTRKESILEFEKGNRQDLIEQTNEEIDILSYYLPEQMSEQEVMSIIDQVFDKVQPSSMKDMGKVMGEITPLIKGKADMSFVSGEIKSRLNS